MTTNVTPTSDDLMIGAGELFFNRRDNATGLMTGERHLGNCTTFNLTTNIEEKKKFSSMHAARTLYKSIITQLGASGKIVMDEYNSYNLALGLFGEDGIFTQPSSVNNEVSLPSVSQGRYYSLGKFKLKNVVIPRTISTPAVIAAPVAVGAITSTGAVSSSGTYTALVPADYFIVVSAANTTSGSASGAKIQWKKGVTGTLSADVTVTDATPILLENGVSVTLTCGVSKNFVVGDTWKITCTPAESTNYVEDADYTVDAKVGRIYIIPGGDIADNASIGVKFDADAVTCVKVVGGNTSKIEGYLRFVGDPTTGPAYHGEFWNISIQPDGELGFISEDWGSITIKFECQDDSANHPKEKFYRLLNLQ
jgi:hypothetical protein